MPTAAGFADRYAQALLAREADSSHATGHTIEVAQDSLAAAAEHGTESFRNDLVRALAKHLTPDCPIRAFGLLANTAGIVVEWGADPGLALGPWRSPGKSPTPTRPGWRSEQAPSPH